MGNLIKTDKKTKTVQVNLEVFLVKEGDYIVAYCPALDLSSFGDDDDDAKAAFEEALDIFIEDTHTKGTLEKVLLDLGWQLKKVPDAKYDPPQRSIKSIEDYRTKASKKITEQVLIPV